MSEVFGWDSAEVARRIGSTRQVARIDSFTEVEGPERGARLLRLVNAGGIEAELHPDRALDIGRVTFRGVPISWLSAGGFGPSAPYEPSGKAWLRSFGGGLLTTCGLDTIGLPSVDQGVSYGQHGRIGVTAARMMRVEADLAHLLVEGSSRQTSVFGENLVLARTIRSATGSDSLTVSDVVTNEGFERAPHMILYHVNLGWPLIDETCEIEIPSIATVPRDEDARKGLDDWRRFGAPIRGFREQVFRHDFDAGDDVVATVRNRKIGLQVDLRFSATTLPYLHQWKMSGEGTYVLGLEPSNSKTLLGRAAARANDQLLWLGPGESINYRIDFRIRAIN